MNPDPFTLVECQIDFYQRNNVPYIGYAWRNWSSGAGGYAIYRLDTVGIGQARQENWPEPSGKFLKEGMPIKINGAGARKILKVAEKLKRDYHNDVQIYQG